MASERLRFLDNANKNEWGFIDYVRSPLRLSFTDLIGVSDGSLNPGALVGLHEQAVRDLSELRTPLPNGFQVEDFALVRVAMHISYATYGSSTTVEFRKQYFHGRRRPDWL